MPKRLGTVRWLRYSVVALIVIGGTAAYLLSYVAARRDQFSNRAFRALSVLVDDFSRRMFVADRSLRQAAGKARELAGQADVPDSMIRAIIEQTIALTPHLSPDIPSGFPPDSTPAGTTVQFELADPALARFRYQPSGQDTVVLRANRTGIHAKARLSDLLETSHLEGDFDEIFLATNDGPLLFRSEPGSYGLTDLRGLSFEDPTATTVREDAAGDNAGEHGAAQVDVSRLGGSSRSVYVDVAGERYNLFIHPVRLPYRTTLRIVGQGTHPTPVRELLVGGLVHAGRQAAKDRQLPANVLLVLFALVLAGVLSAPLFKVSYIGAAERYGAFDIVLLAGSAVVTTALLAFFFLDLAQRQRLQSDLEEEAEQLSESIVSNLKDELTMANLTVKEFFDAVDWFQNEGGYGRPDSTEIIKFGADGKRLGAILKEAPFIEMVFWVDENGVQKRKWTVQEESTPRIGVADRRYFRAASSGSRVEPRASSRYIRSTASSLASRCANSASKIAAPPSCTATHSAVPTSSGSTADGSNTPPPPIPP